jgi:hypothetical protein
VRELLFWFGSSYWRDVLSEETPSATHFDKGQEVDHIPAHTLIRRDAVDYSRSGRSIDQKKSGSIHPARGRTVA